MTDRFEERPPEPGLLEEYRTICDEQAALRLRRFLTLGFALVAVAALAGVGLRTDQHAAAVALAALLLLAVATSLTRDQTLRLALIAGYLARYVEPQLGATAWSLRWRQLRQASRTGGVRWGVGVGEARILGGAYAALALGATLLYELEARDQDVLVRIAVGVCGLLAFANAFDIAARVTPWWASAEAAWKQLEDWLVQPVQPGRGPLYRSQLKQAWAVVTGRARREWRKVTSELERAAAEPRPAAGGREVALEAELLEDAVRRCGLEPPDVKRILEDAEDPRERGTKRTDVPPAVHRSVSALARIGETLVGGLEPKGVRKWLSAGTPPRLDRILGGRSDEVLAEARAYTGSAAT